MNTVCEDSCIIEFEKADIFKIGGNLTYISTEISTDYVFLPKKNEVWHLNDLKISILTKSSLFYTNKNIGKQMSRI